jgi:hypothetical protein
MTDLMSRPILRVEPAAAPSRPVALPAVAAGLVACAVGLLVCIAVAVTAWFAADAGSFPPAIRTGALAWLLGSGASLKVDGVAVTAIPLGLTMAAAWMLYRGGRWAAGRSTVTTLADVATGAGCIAAAYAVVGLAAAAVTRTGDVHADLLRLAVTSVLLGGVFGGAGLLRGAGLAPRLGNRLPEEVRAAVVGAAAGVCVMLLAAALLVGVSLSQHFSTASTLASALHAGSVGGVVMAVVGALTVPNAVLCAGAYIAGPGFALGTGSSVSPVGTLVGPVPAVPLLGILPNGSSALAFAGLIVPVLAGFAAGYLTRSRSLRGGATPAGRLALVAIGIGCFAGVVVGLLAWSSSGSLGPGRLQDAGPNGWLVGLAVGVEVAAGALIGAFSAHRRS